MNTRTHRFGCVGVGSCDNQGSMTGRQTSAFLNTQYPFSSWLLSVFRDRKFRDTMITTITIESLMMKFLHELNELRKRPALGMFISTAQRCCLPCLWGSGSCDSQEPITVWHTSAVLPHDCAKMVLGSFLKMCFWQWKVFLQRGWRMDGWTKRYLWLVGI